MNLGLVFEHGDFVLKSLFVLLVLMSITSWVVIIWRTHAYCKARKANRIAAGEIWAAADLEEAEARARKTDSPISEVALDGIAASRRFDADQANMLSAHLPRNAYLERELRHSIGKVMGRFEGGMTALATIGSTAPFVGLLGTVWGIYHALINISQSGQMSIAAVSGPIGEALVATAFGLFAAIPAVLAYNFFTRGNKMLSRGIHNFAHDWHVQLINHNKE